MAIDAVAKAATVHPRWNPFEGGVMPCRSTGNCIFSRDESQQMRAEYTVMPWQRPRKKKKGTFSFFQPLGLVNQGVRNEKAECPLFLFCCFPVEQIVNMCTLTPMPRTMRASVGGVCYHVVNRGNGRATVFHNSGDYAAFLRLMAEAGDRVPMRLLAYCLMPNHFHIVLWPYGDGDLSRWMQWLMTSHVRRYHKHHSSSGHVWQGRFKAFPIQGDEHLLTVMRYVERNPVRSIGLAIPSACMWQWSSAAKRRAIFGGPQLDPGPVARQSDWLSWVDRPLTSAEEGAIKKSIARGSPFGDDDWTKATATRLGLESSLRPRGRPAK